jgi:hypothetical protein
MGSGFEGQVGATQNINLNVDPSSPRNYSALITVPPGVPPGTYKLVVTINYLTPANQPGFMAGYQEGPILQFFNP